MRRHPLRNHLAKEGGRPSERGTRRDPHPTRTGRKVEVMAEPDAPGDAHRDAPHDVRGDVRAQIREFLTTRRARITPEQAGLPSYGGDRRRVPGLRRSEVALLVGVSPQYYIRLERGDATGVSESVIEGIAQALRLDGAERAHLL